MVRQRDGQKVLLAVNSMGGVERDVVGLCEQYLDLLVREVEAVEKASRPTGAP